MSNIADWRRRCIFCPTSNLLELTDSGRLVLNTYLAWRPPAMLSLASVQRKPTNHCRT